MPRKASGEPKVKRVERPQSNGNIYVYEVTTRYNPEKRYNEHVSSRLLGIKAPDGSIVPTRPHRSSKADSVSVRAGDILGWIGRESGIDECLYCAADKKTAQKIISIARFWTANLGKSVRCMEEWQINHPIPCPEELSEEECFSLMNQLAQDAFLYPIYFSCLADLAPTGESIVTVGTSVSSYSDLLHGGPASVKTLTLFSAADYRPIAFSCLPGNDADAVSILKGLKSLSGLGLERPRLVLDGDFFTDSNILAFIHAGTEFVMRGRLDAEWIFPALQAVAGEMPKPSHAWPEDPGIYCVAKEITRRFSPAGTDGETKEKAAPAEEHRLYLYFALDTEKAAEDRTFFLKEIQRVKRRIVNGESIARLSAYERRIADRFLTVKKTQGRTEAALKDDEIMEQVRYYGFFVLVSNRKEDAFRAVREYRLRGKAEDVFRVDNQPYAPYITRSGAVRTLDGWFFCRFVAYGYEAYFQRKIDELIRTLSGDLARGRSKDCRKEESLLAWLQGMSPGKLLDWFDVTRENTADTAMGKARWQAETVERDRLFLTRMGIADVSRGD